jgi:hypothetical protein
MEVINMKRLSMVMLILMLSSFVITFTSCETDTDDLTGPIDNSLPEITAVDASATTIPVGAVIDVSVTASNGDSYSWSADAGEFSDPNSASTSWNSSSLSSNSVVKLVCTVTNSSGSRNGSVSITAVILTTPTHHWTFDTDLTSESGIEAVGEGVTLTNDAKDGMAALCAGEEDPANIPIVMDGSQLPTGPEDVYTIMAWIKSDDIGFSVYSKVHPEEFWDWEGYCKTWVFFYDYGYPSNVALAGVWNPIMWEDPGSAGDGEWHHFAAVHNESDLYTFYVDGEEVGGGDGWYGSTSDDEETALAMGGGGWGTVLNGVLDDFKYYNQVIGSAEIALLALQ